VRSDDNKLYTGSIPHTLPSSPPPLPPHPAFTSRQADAWFPIQKMNSKKEKEKFKTKKITSARFNLLSYFCGTLNKPFDIFSGNFYPPTRGAPCSLAPEAAAYLPHISDVTETFSA